jgi:hypothetical protein
MYGSGHFRTDSEKLPLQKGNSSEQNVVAGIGGIQESTSFHKFSLEQFYVTLRF